MDEDQVRASDVTRRRVYLVALGFVGPWMPIIGWLRLDAEAFVIPVYGTLTVTIVLVFLGLLTRRLAVTTAEGLLVSGISVVVLARLAGVVLLVDLDTIDLRRLVVEMTGPSLTACVLLIYLAAELRTARNWAVTVWAVFTVLLVPALVSAWGRDPELVGALIGQSVVVAVTVGLAYGLASIKGQLAEEQVRAQALDELAHTDPLTHVRNRRGAEEVLERELATVARYGGHLSVVLLDLDHFKERNDYHGHAAGDEALIMVVEALSAELRASDVITRWGGDELLVVAPGTAPAEAARSAERWRRIVEELGLAAGPGRVTASGGVAAYRDGDNIDTLVTRADRALYAAKRRGGNLVETDEGQDEPGIVPAQDGPQRV